MSEANQIEGVPEGWRLVRISKWPRVGEYAIYSPGEVVKVTEPDQWDLACIVEKIEPPKPKYRPFANAEEFKPYRDRWWYFKDDQRNHRRPAASYDDIGISAWDWKEMLERAFFEDGTPFGIEVKE